MAEVSPYEFCIISHAQCGTGSHPSIWVSTHTQCSGTSFMRNETPWGYLLRHINNINTFQECGWPKWLIHVSFNPYLQQASELILNMPLKEKTHLALMQTAFFSNSSSSHSYHSFPGSLMPQHPRKWGFRILGSDSPGVRLPRSKNAVYPVLHRGIWSDSPWKLP